MVRMSDCVSGRDNNFNLIRFFAASAVVLSHSVLIANGKDTIEPLEALTGYTLGDHAVNIFFAMSGFLVCKSLLSRNDLAAYASARFLRIVPGLFFMGVMSALVLGPLVTGLPLIEYFTSPQTWYYAPLIGSLVADPLNQYLPGVFSNNPFPEFINGPLWTLRYEAIAYIGLVIAFLIGFFTNTRRYMVLLGLISIVFIAYAFYNPAPESRSALDHLMRFGLIFILGSGFYMLRKYITLRLPVAAALLAITIMLHSTPLYQASLLLFTAYASFWVAFVPKGFIRKFNKLGDYSYGIYIYGWPIAQAVAMAFPGIAPPELFIIGYALCLPIAAASWHLIESPALAMRFALADLLRRKAPQTA